MTPYWSSPDGRHLLYCGDCLEILPTLEAGSVDFVFTDPPYGHTENGSLQQRFEAALGWKDGVGVYRDTESYSRLIANDGAEANDLYRAVLPEFFRLLQPGCCCCCCGGGGGPDPQFARWSLWMDEVFAFKQAVIWDKGPMGMGWHYRRSYEVILVGEKPGAACRWYDETNKVENILRPVRGTRKVIPSADDHPTVKPVGLAMHFVNLHTLPEHLVLDPFAGSGTTAAACIRTGRRSISIELNPAYCEVAVRRMERELAQPQLVFDEPETEIAFTGSLFE